MRRARHPPKRAPRRGYRMMLMRHGLLVPPEAAVPNLNILISPADKPAGWLGCIAGSREQPLKAPFPSNGALSMIQGGCAQFADDT
ncbi:hypothetical protein PG988_012011 [Apiospora saccharicola]